MFWRKKEKQAKEQPVFEDIASMVQPEETIPKDINQVEKKLQELFANCTDIQIKRFQHVKTNQEYLLVWVEGLVDKQALREHVMEALIQTPVDKLNMESLIKGLLPVMDVSKEKNLQKALENLLIGKPLLILEKSSEAIVLGLVSYEKRDVTESQDETTIRGPREAFTESIQTNMALLRKRIRTPNYKTESIQLGTFTKNQIIISYLEGVVDPEIVTAVRKRVGSIQIDSILESTYIEEFIEDNPFSPFPQIEHTLKPDKVSASILQGRVAILVEGTPTVLLVPCTFATFLQPADDYYERYYYMTVIRILRLIYINIAMVLPALYISMTTFHPEMLPTRFLISLSAGRENVPFPALVEVLIMEITFEVLREAGLRLPKQIGQTVSIVGALVIGQAAVQAGIVSPVLVILVSTTAIASFAIPAFNLSYALRILKFPLVFIASFLGIYGLALGLLFILIHLCRLTSFGIPYLSGFAPFIGRDAKDVFIRAPWWMMNQRPVSYRSVNQERQPLIKNLLSTYLKKWREGK